MIFDSTNLFSDAQAITGDAVSTNVIDLGADRNIGVGNPVPLLIQVVEDFDDGQGTMTSLTITLETADNEAMSTNQVDLLEVVVPMASLKAGYKTPFIYVPRGAKRFLRLKYDVTGNDPIAGKITAGFVLAAQDGFDGD